MPHVKFLRTPTRAEMSVEHDFREGEVHEVSKASLGYWLGLPGAVEEVAPPAAIAGLDEDVAQQAALADTLSVRHTGKGRWAVYRGDERVTTDPLLRAEAEAELERIRALPAGEPAAASDQTLSTESTIPAQVVSDDSTRASGADGGGAAPPSAADPADKPAEPPAPATLSDADKAAGLDGK